MGFLLGIIALRRVKGLNGTILTARYERHDQRTITLLAKDTASQEALCPRRRHESHDSLPKKLTQQENRLEVFASTCHGVAAVTVAVAIAIVHPLVHP